MDSTHRHRIRLPVALISTGFVVALMLACCNPASPRAQAAVTICAQDPDPGSCRTGDFRAVGASQTLALTATDKDGKPLASKSVSLKVSGANGHSDTRTTDSQGRLTYTYSGGTPGDDVITASVPNGDTTLTSGPVAIHWLTPRHARHPVIFLHGIAEDAADFNVQLHPGTFTDSDQFDPGEASEQDWSALLTALSISFDPTYMEAFCYTDDKAWNTNTPSGCPDGSAKTCLTAAENGGTSTCVSEGMVETSAVALASVILALNTRAGGTKVSLMAYSMGSAILRTLLGGCARSSGADQTTCQQALQKVDRVFFLNGAQQGSWLLTVRNGYDAAALAGQGIPVLGKSPFGSALPLLEQKVFAVVQDKVGLDVTQPATTDLTPQSDNILGHNQSPPPASIQYYTFYGNDRLAFEVTLLVYTLPGKTYLPLGDLVMLAQDDRATYSPLWGGATLCDGCDPLAAYQGANYYHDNTAHATPGVDPIYHEWELRDDHTVNINVIVPLLSGIGAVPALQDFLGSPVSHLSVGQPGTQAPGTAWQIHDITKPGSGQHTDMPYEILAILLTGDGLSA